MDKEFCLTSSILSPSWPPLAAIGLLTAIESKQNWANVVFEILAFTKFIVAVSIFPKVLASTLDWIPPPVKYLTVNVVFEGAIP